MFKINIRKSGLALSTSLTPSLSSAGKPRVKVGFPAGKSDAGSIQKAVWNEFGTRGGASGGGWGGPIPERPFMRNAMRSNEGKYKDSMAKAARSILIAEAVGQDTSSSVRTALTKLGIMAQGDIQDEITSLSSPPNSPVTIALKRSSNPLIDTGEMRQAVTYEVDE